MLLSELIAFNLFAWISSFTPGPNVALAIATGVRYGVRAVLPQIVGVSLGFLFMLWTLGLSGVALLETSPFAVQCLKVAGIIYLLYLAWTLARSASIRSSSGLKALTVPQAILFQTLNPKAWMMVIAALSSYVLGHGDFLSRMGLISIGFIVPTALSLLSWAWLGERMRSWLCVGSRLLKFNRLMGFFLALTALWMALQ